MSTDTPDRGTPRWQTLAAGALLATAARALLGRAILFKLKSDLRALNAGDYRPLLSSYSKDAVLFFNEGSHRWAGEHRGRQAIERFLRDFVAAGLKGEIKEMCFGGPLWRLTLMVRFDDHAHGPDGEQLYANRTALLARTRWGKVVWQQDFYEDTARIGALDARLTEMGVLPAR